MKRNNFRFFGLAIFLAGVFLFTACNQFLNNSTGGITVNLPNGNARLAADDLNTYTISLLDSSGKAAKSVSVSGGSCTIDNIEPGEYTVSVAGGYKDSYGMQYTTAQGKAGATVTVGETAEANIVLKQTGFFVAQNLYNNDSWVNGDDNNSGNSPESPLKNLQTAIDRISRINSDNDDKIEYTIYVKGTIYPREENGSYKMADFSDIPTYKKLNLSIVGVNVGEVQTTLNGKTENGGSTTYGSIVMIGGNDSKNNLNLSLINLVLRDSATDKGGGLFNKGANVTIKNCTFSNNTATDSGGAIYNEGGTINIFGGILGGEDQNDCNFANSGGAIYNTDEGKVIINSSTIRYNAASSYGGGAIYNNGELTIIGGTFDNNVCSDSGAIYNNKGKNLRLGGDVLFNINYDDTTDYTKNAIYLKESIITIIKPLTNKNKKVARITCRLPNTNQTLQILESEGGVDLASACTRFDVIAGGGTYYENVREDGYIPYKKP